MRRLLIHIDATDSTCGYCPYINIGDGSSTERADCDVFSVGLQKVGGDFQRVTGCLNAERVASEGAPAA